MTTRSQYAAGPDVSVTRTQEQIKVELQRLGAGQRLIYEDDEAGRAVVAFQREGIQYRILLPLLALDDERFWYRGVNQYRSGTSTPAQAKTAWQQDIRERWRGLAEYIKALRIAYEAEIVKIESALLPYAVLPDGQTVEQWVAPQLPAVYASGDMPPLYPGLEAPRVVPQLRIEAAQEEGE